MIRQKRNCSDDEKEGCLKTCNFYEPCVWISCEWPCMLIRGKWNFFIYSTLFLGMNNAKFIIMIYLERVTENVHFLTPKMEFLCYGMAIWVIRTRNHVLKISFSNSVAKGRLSGYMHAVIMSKHFIPFRVEFLC